MLRAGETPFLHVDVSNERGIEVYRRLGFVVRTRLPLLHAKRIS
jgi:ribosomal protein S18 acetylase RimI-like enzyme